MKNKFEGVFTALVTPFLNGDVDYDSLESLVKFQVENGVSGFVVNGTTAESPTLSKEEVKKIYQTVKKHSKNLPLVLGVGTNATLSTIENCKMAQELGADAVLVVVPYYNKPPQRGMIKHFTQVADASRLPVILYNVPGRTVVTMEAQTILELSQHQNIVGIKEASGNINVLREIASKLNEDFLLSSGDDESSIEFCMSGGKGVISVISHVIPKAFSRLVAEASTGKDVSVQYKEYNELNSALCLDANPIPVKMALYKMGVIASPELRSPLDSLESKNEAPLEQALNNLGLIDG